MKRVKAACIIQTLHFMLKEEMGHEYAVKCARYEVEKYKRNQWRRISIKPGLTGMWQVSGRSKVQNFDDIVELDTEYIDNWSLWLDIKILLKTVVVLLKHNDAY